MYIRMAKTKLLLNKRHNYSFTAMLYTCQDCSYTKEHTYQHNYLTLVSSTCALCIVVRK